MRNYKAMLVAVDLAGGTEQVLKKVADLPKEDDTKVVLVNVGEYPIVGYLGMYGAEAGFSEVPPPIDSQKIREDTVSMMKSKAVEQGVSVDRFLFEFGKPVEKILWAAEQEAVDLIVLWSHGHHGFNILLGSTANGVLHRADCDVLTVRLSE